MAAFPGISSRNTSTVMMTKTRTEDCAGFTEANAIPHHLTPRVLLSNLSTTSAVDRSEVQYLKYLAGELPIWIGSEKLERPGHWSQRGMEYVPSFQESTSSKQAPPRNKH
jgi:hypothetical protein